MIPYLFDRQQSNIPGLVILSGLFRTADPEAEPDPVVQDVFAPGMSVVFAEAQQNYEITFDRPLRNILAVYAGCPHTEVLATAARLQAHVESIHHDDASPQRVILAVYDHETEGEDAGDRSPTAEAGVAVWFTVIGTYEDMPRGLPVRSPLKTEPVGG